jgi:putative transposon-encoded protein
MDRYETQNAKEVLDQTVKPFGSGGAHITVPKRWIGADVKVVRVSDPDPDE